jgi:hypothetical protein
MSNETDRRKYHRIGTDQVISYSEIDSPGRLGVGKDISSGGIRFEAVGCEFNLGDIVRVTFNILEQTVVATGQIMWATDTDPITTEVGIHFIEIDPEALRLLEDSFGVEADEPGAPLR